MMLIILASFALFWVAVPVLLAIARTLGFYLVVGERECFVYTLFGKVVTVFDEPGLHSLWTRIGPRALLVPWLGKRYTIDQMVAP